uniref:receptor protein-tyrosine kinase n=1 Tax=Cyclopterus lumpus TaxID=8103 RepID=A0A8C3GB73_CYCLU
MRSQRNMIAVVFLLCAVKLHCSDGIAAQNQACVPSHEVACFVPADYLNASGSVSVEVCVGKKLNISLEHFSEFPVCHWIRGANPILTVNGSNSMVLPPLSETDSGEFTLSCEISDGTRSSLAVSLHVVMKRPTKPKLTLDKVDSRMRSPYFTCISEGFPKPTLKWTGNNDGTNVPANSVMAISTISSSEYSHCGVLCCATNAEGQECSQVYDYDLDADFMKHDEVSKVTVSPGQPLLLRCRIKSQYRLQLAWMNGSKIMNTNILSCSSTVKKEICIKSDGHKSSRMAYLFIESVNGDHGGTYTCMSPNNKTKSVDVHVQAEGFLSVQMDKSLIIPAQNASRSGLQATVSYHPVLQRCSWEAPDKNVTKCIRDNWVTKHRIVKLRDVLKSGDYKLHLEAGGQIETKTISVCVVDTPKFKFRINKANTFTFETASLVPANYTWMSCSLSNDSICETDSSWEEIPDASQTDTDVFCEKTIKSSLSRDLVDGHHLRFCLTNSVGSWCQTQYSIYYTPSPKASTGSSNYDNSSMMVLKVGSLILLMALAIVSMVLMYFVKKKKPQYQPQLQIIQMVGPNDNDYIYINFKDFGYDLKWEFPRENLELGPELGSGAFGMVVQATAYGINKPGVSQQVAVKMLKEKHQTVEKEALMSELKMLTHIGHHANIVNLLGACTDSGPIYLIFQYCCYGDLLNYLKTNRERYHKSVTDAFNKDRFSSLYHNLQPRKRSGELDTAVDNYVPMYGSTTRGQEDIALLTDNSDPMIHEDPDDQTDLQTEDLQT